METLVLLRIRMVVHKNVFWPWLNIVLYLLMYIRLTSVVIWLRQEYVCFVLFFCFFFYILKTQSLAIKIQNATSLTDAHVKVSLLKKKMYTYSWIIQKSSDLHILQIHLKRSDGHLWQQHVKIDWSSVEEPYIKTELACVAEPPVETDLAYVAIHL